VKKIIFSISIFLFLTIISAIAQNSTLFDTCRVTVNLGDVTNKLENLGNIPINQGMMNRDQNIWDLQKFQDRIYIGYGNSTTNPGPIKLWSIDAERNFNFEKEVNTEVVQKFRVYDDNLYVPNGDPKGGVGDMSKLISKSSSGEWKSYNWEPSLAHVRDIIQYQGKFYLMGNSWGPLSVEAQYTGMHVTNTDFSEIDTDLLAKEFATIGSTEVIGRRAMYNWFFGAYVFRDSLVIPNGMLRTHYESSELLHIDTDSTVSYLVTGDKIQWSGNMEETERISKHHLYPIGTTDYTEKIVALRPFESIEYKDKLLIAYRTYSMSSGNNSVDYNNSAGMICKSHWRDEAKFVTFPDGESVGEDLLLINEELFVLSNVKKSENEYITYVYKTTAPSNNPESWREVLHFSSTNMMRSFEFMDGFFYFGLGSNKEDNINNTGRILRVQAGCKNIINCLYSGTSCDDGDLCTTNDTYDISCNCVGTLIDNNENGVCDILDCKPALYIRDTIQNVHREFSARNYIESDAIINSPFTIKFSAEENVILQPGFETRSPNLFIIENKPCQE